MRRLPFLVLAACNVPGLTSPSTPTHSAFGAGPTPSAPTPRRPDPAVSAPAAAAPAPAAPAPAAPAPAAPAAAAPAAIDAALEPLRPLLGAWEGSDPDLHATGRFTLEPDLGGKVLVRRNRNDSPQGHHDDLLIVFPTPTGLRASYFDSEGHAIQYTVLATPDRIELISDEASNQPRFRLRYDRHGADDFAVEFAIAAPGAPDFKHYTGGTVHRAH